MFMTGQQQRTFPLFKYVTKQEFQAGKPLRRSKRGTADSGKEKRIPREFKKQIERVKW